MILGRLLLFLQCAYTYKYLIYNPQFGNSHVNFIGRLTDAIVDAGHEAVVVSPAIDPTCGRGLSKKARVIEIPQCPEAAAFYERMRTSQGAISSVWVSDAFSHISAYQPMLRSWVDQCRFTLTYPGLLEELREEKFDAAFAESLDHCAFVLFHEVGIEKWAVTQTMAVIDTGSYLYQVPPTVSYTPSMMGGQQGDQMNLFERFSNLLYYLKMEWLLERNLDMFQEEYDKLVYNAPSIRDIMSNASLVFLNSDPMIDFPKLTSSRILDIGGISVHSGHTPLNKTWSDIMNLRNKTVLLSFGTFVKAHLMPETFKRNIRETLKKFPDVTFIWKYEKPEDGVSGNLSNVIETTWAPQHDLLFDHRLSAFITHGGQGSITEASAAGVPLIAIPITADQLRNGASVRRNNVGVMLNKEDLGRMGPLEDAIKEVLGNKIYAENARELSQMITDRPFKQKEVFIRNMDFLAKHGPLRRLDHYGYKLSFVQYYLLDIAALFFMFSLASIVLLFFFVRYAMKNFPVRVTLKRKGD